MQKTGIVADLEDVPTTSFRRLFRHWMALTARHGALPAWSQFSIEAVTDLLPDISIVSHEKSTGRFKIRRCGIDLVRFLGKNLAGRYVDELTNGEAFNTGLCEMINHRQAYYFERYNAVGPHGKIGALGLFILPLISEEGTAPDHFMVASQTRGVGSLNKLTLKEKATAKKAVA